MGTLRARSHRWIFAAAGAAAVVLLVPLLFRAPEARLVKPLPTVAGPAPGGVRLVSLKKNDAALTDPTPLFLPTEWNAGQNALPANTQREPGGSFQGYPAKLAFAENDLKLNLPAAVAVPRRPADALASDRSSQMVVELGRTDGEITQIVTRKAFVEILQAGDGERLLSQALPDAAPPGRAWQPLEFLVAVDAAGLVGPPVLTESSRVAAVDGYFQNYLVKTLHAGQRLAPGFYRICIGP